MAVKPRLRNLHFDRIIWGIRIPSVVYCCMGFIMSWADFGFSADRIRPFVGTEIQVTRGPGGRILTNTSCWSPDSQWLVYDVRSDPAGDIFDGSRMEAVHVETQEVRLLYQSTNGAHCGVSTFHPRRPWVIFILGPEHPTDDWRYGPNHRQGVIVDWSQPGQIVRLDARDLVAPLTPGALRGGTHVHVWDAAGDWLALTYNDALVEPGLRDIGIAVPGHKVRVKTGHARNHDGDWFCGLVTRTVPAPRPGSDEIKRANEEGWIGVNGYVRVDGSRQRRAIAFQGLVVTENGEDVTEVFVVDLPDELTEADRQVANVTVEGRIEPLSTVHQRRLTRTTNRRFPGIQGTRHWLRSSPDGTRIAFYMRDDNGVSQIWTVSPATGEMNQLTHNSKDISSAMSWSANGRWIAHGLAGHVCLTDTTTGETRPLFNLETIERFKVSGNSLHDFSVSQPAGEMRKEACVISPDQKKIAFVRSTKTDNGTTNQICVIELEKELSNDPLEQ